MTPRVTDFNLLERLVTFMGLLGHLSVYFQAGKIIYLGSAYAVSFTGTLLALMSMIAWFSYGIQKHIKPLIITNAFGLIGAVTVIWGILYFGEAPPSNSSELAEKKISSVQYSGKLPSA